MSEPSNITALRCDDVRARLDALVDGELSARESAALGEHLASCASCSAEFEATLATVAALRERLPRHTAPDVLRGRVRAALRAEASGVADSSPREAPVGARARRRRLLPSGAWRALAAAAVVAAVGVGGTLAARRTPDDAPLAHEIEASHVRSLMLAHLVDVPSTDQHTVKPWFAGKLDYAPTVTRLDSLGFPMVGGRVDYVDGRAVAVVVYKRREHVINLYAWPTSARDDATAETGVRGYHLLRWRAGGTEHWAVSDVNVAELRAFVDAIRRAEASR